MIDLSIIIVNFNTKQLLIDCVKSIVDSSPKVSYEIIVVDNASSDDSVKEFKSLFTASKFKIIKNEKNEGFSKANNIGIKEARGRYVLFLNSDTVVYPETLETMVKFMDKNEDAGAATCKVLLPNGKLDDASHRGFPTPWNAYWHFSGVSKLFSKSKLFAGYNLGYLDLNKVHEIDACAGAFMIVKRTAGEKVNWWDEDYFWYGDDLDLCFRLKEAGFKIYFVPDVSILHYKGASGGIKKISQNISGADKNTKKLAQRARFEAMRIFYKKHYKNKYPWFINRLVDSGIYLRQKVAFL
ncbi:MAG: glycosyltransferase family 2 protein [Patescibacteria group bacterium]|nr:glycosyltransferase family 2 protein [Patescibacteria group bacterium]